ncbi:MAG: AIR synthase, partial [Chloroflexi bacterium]|nr:AIR synthase [Chloroflexota bacterium]
PVGVLATLLFPAGIDAEQIGELMAEIDATARQLNVEVLGGHTEIAPGVSAPLVVMSGVGKARADRVLTAGGGRPGDVLVLTRAAGLEGTQVLASDLGGVLLSQGVPASVLEQARGYADELSVVPEARLAVELGATAMHDPTEGGVLGAAWEMAEAAGCGLRVSARAIPVREPTRAISAALGADPLRLIASGALLIACKDGPSMVAGLGARGVAAAEIGTLVPLEGGRVLVRADGREETIESVSRDELYRILEDVQP